MNLGEKLTELTSDKASLHGTDWAFSYLFSHRRDDVQKVMEIGIGRGGSIRVWREYFPQAEIVAIDNHPELCEPLKSLPGVTTFVLNQSDPVALRAMLAEVGSDFDLIVDDGGHIFEPQVVSFETLWPAVKPGGVYVVEDVHVSWRGGKGLKQPSIVTWLIEKVLASVQKPRRRWRPAFCFFQDACFIVKPWEPGRQFHDSYT